MARMYQSGRIKSADIILAEPQNDEINQAVGELNGGLDQHNMPLDSVSRTKLQPGVKTTVAGPPAYTSTVWPSQAYHIAESSAAAGSIAIENWQMGWNKFELGAGNDKNGFVLDFQATEGMLKGEACIDFEHRQSYFLFKYQLGGVGAFQVGTKIKDEHVGELGVFVNDVLVGRTGPLWIACGRHSYAIPFSTPIGSVPCHIDVRWLVDFKNLKQTFTVGTNYEIGVNQVYPVQFHHRTLWVRNQFR